MPAIKFRCPECNRVVYIDHETHFPAQMSEDGTDIFPEHYMIELSCSHVIFKEVPDVSEDKLDLSSVDGKFKAHDFQTEAIKRAIKTGSHLFDDDMGLGKTIQGILTVKNLQAYPCLVVLKSSVKLQWMKQIKKWDSDELTTIFPIDSTKTPAIPGFKYYVISMDLFGRKSKDNKEYITVEKLKNIPFKSLLLDESHLLKDDNAGRTIGLFRLVNSVPSLIHRFPISGTPIKNRAGEIFNPLNLIDPLNNPSRRDFESQWLSWDKKRIAHYKLDDWNKVMERYSTRRTKKDVYPNWSPPQINQMFVEIDNPQIKGMYNSQLNLFANFLNSSSNIGSMELLGWLARFRRLTAEGKLNPAIEIISEFLETSDRKLAIGIHHNDARDYFYNALNMAGYLTLKLSGEDSAQSKFEIVNKFKDDQFRLIVINQLSGGLGLDGLQENCSDILQLEREWSPADENQFTSRFDREGQKNPVFVNQVIASGTIDDFMSQILEEKKQIVGDALDGYSLANDTQGLKQLSERVISNPLR